MGRGRRHNGGSNWEKVGRPETISTPHRKTTKVTKSVFEKQKCLWVWVGGVTTVGAQSMSVFGEPLGYNGAELGW